MAPTARLTTLAPGMTTVANFVCFCIMPAQAGSMPKFLKFPIEVQRMIWKSSFPPPQVITITQERRGREPNTSTYTDDKPSAPYHKIPAMLHACRESRATALERYTESFQARLRQPIYYDSERDTLFMIDRWTLQKFHRGRSLLPGESQNIEDTVRHMAIATSDVVDLGTINRLLKFHLVTLQLERCGDHHYSTLEVDDRRNFSWNSVGDILMKDWEKAAKKWGRKPTKITHLTRQEMFDSSDIGEEYKARKSAYDLDIGEVIRERLPGVSDAMLHHMVTDLYPPIFNGMKINRMKGYYTQEERINMFLDICLVEPRDCSICCASAEGWDTESSETEASDSND